MRRFRLTKAAKILILMLVNAVLGIGVSVGLNSGSVKFKDNGNKAETSVDYDADGNVMNTEKTDDKAINLSLDEWIG